MWYVALYSLLFVICFFCIYCCLDAAQKADDAMERFIDKSDSKED